MQHIPYSVSLHYQSGIERSILKSSSYQLEPFLITALSVWISGKQEMRELEAHHFIMNIKKKEGIVM